MNSARSFPFPAPQTAASMSPLGEDNTSVAQNTSSTSNQPSLLAHRSVDSMMNTPPPKPSRIYSSPTSIGLVKGQNDARRSRANTIARSITAPVARFFHFDSDKDGNGDGLDFRCCGEAPLRPPRRAGWLGTLEVDEMPASFAAIDGKSHKASGAVGVLGSPWCPKSCGQPGDLALVTSPLGASPPPLASSGSSPPSGEDPLASPSYFRGQHIVFGSPGSYLASNHAIQSLRFTPPGKNMAKSLGGPNAAPTRRTKISIDTISAPIMTDLNTRAKGVPRTRN